MVLSIVENEPARDHFFYEKQLALVQFRGLVEKLAVLGAAEGVVLIPYEDRDLPFFQKLSLEEQRVIVNLMGSYTQVMEEVVREERHIVNNKNSLWRMLSRLRWLAPDDLFPFLSDQDVIEIYDQSGRQLYRSFNFFPLCTYTIEQIYTVPWFDLYERDEEMTQANLTSALDVLRHPELGTRPNSCPVHEVREKQKPIRRCTRIEPGILSPLRDLKGNVVGFVNSFRPISSADLPSHVL